MIFTVKIDKVDLEVEEFRDWIKFEEKPCQGEARSAGLDESGCNEDWKRSFHRSLSVFGLATDW